MLAFWEPMGICQLDEDHRILKVMEQTEKVSWLCEVAEEAKAVHYEWVRANKPDLVSLSTKGLNIGDQLCQYL